MVERQSSSSSAHEGSRDVRAELDGDSKRDDQVDEGDRVETDSPNSHHPHDFEDGESAGDGDDCSCSPRSEEEGGDEEDGYESEGEDLNGDGDDVGVLEEEMRIKVEFPRVHRRRWKKRKEPT